MSAVLTVARTDLRAATHPNLAGANDLALPGACHVHLITSRSQQTRILVGSLWFDSNVVESAAFVAFGRYYLGLLPLLRPWCTSLARYPSPGVMNVCAGGHPNTALLTPDAGHCISCPSCFAPRHAAHERINKVYAQFAREAGAEVNYNPSTNLMLGNQYGDAARMLFPKKSTPARIQAATALLKALKLYASSPDPLVRAEAQKDIAAIMAQCPKNLEGLRVDCIIRTRANLLWLDIGVVHPTAYSKLKAVIDFVLRLDTAEIAANGTPAASTLAGLSSPTVVAYHKVKVTRYSPLVADAAIQVKNGTRTSTPVFVPCIFSHSGEMSPESLRVVELITREYAATVATKYFEDGVPLKHRTAAFRTRFKDALMTANANGFGCTLAFAGTPRAGRELTPAEAYGGLPDWEVVY
jgi:hypothetical protein